MHPGIGAARTGDSDGPTQDERERLLEGSLNSSNVGLTCKAVEWRTVIRQIEPKIQLLLVLFLGDAALWDAAG
jgi:hypothetical protein